MAIRRIARTFASGLVTLLPVLITVVVLVWLVKTAATVFGAMLDFVVPGEVHSTLLGLLVAIGVIFVTGLLMEGIFFRRLLNWIEDWINRIPLVKTIYGPARDLMSLLAKNDRKFSKVVMVRLPGSDIRALGFVTVDDFTGSPVSPGADLIAVYLPMSYQIGGYTLFLPRDCLTPVDMSLEDAMRFVVTAGMSRTPPAP